MRWKYPKREEWYVTKVTRIIVSTLGILFALSGMSHGFFEVLQGNTPTEGILIAAIADSHRMWPHGSEYAFTLLPNFLVTGIAAMVVSLAIIIWSVGFVHKKYGSVVLLLLFVILFLVGGGIAQVIFFTMIWAVSTRIDTPLLGWRRILPKDVRRILAVFWPWTLAVGSLLLLEALWIAITGYVPGMTDPELVLKIMLACVAISFGAFLITIISGFAYDIEQQVRMEG